MTRVHRLSVLCASAFLLSGSVRITRADWPTNPSTNLPLATLPHENNHPAMASDGFGGFIVVWDGWRDHGGQGSQRYKIYAQLVNDDGSLGTPTVVRPSSTPEIQSLDAAPNPFSRETTLAVSLRRPSSLQIEVFTVTGKRVLVRMIPALSAGTHRIALTIRDEGGDWLPSGIYLCRVSSVNDTMTRKLTIAR
jgi:hypothetical protein